MLIVVPSLLSGAGIIFILTGIWVDHWVVRNICFTVGAVLLWIEFFITMAIFRHRSRSTDRRLARLEESLERGDID